MPKGMLSGPMHTAGGLFRKGLTHVTILPSFTPAPDPIRKQRITSTQRPSHASFQTGCVFDSQGWGCQLSSCLIQGFLRWVSGAPVSLFDHIHPRAVGSPLCRPACAHPHPFLACCGF